MIALLMLVLTKPPKVPTLTDTWDGIASLKLNDDHEMEGASRLRLASYIVGRFAHTKNSAVTVGDIKFRHFLLHDIGHVRSRIARPQTPGTVGPDQVIPDPKCRFM